MKGTSLLAVSTPSKAPILPGRLVTRWIRALHKDIDALPVTDDTPETGHTHISMVLQVLLQRHNSNRNQMATFSFLKAVPTP